MRLQPHPPPCALGCTLQHLAVTKQLYKRFPCHSQSFCSIILPASTQDTQAEKKMDYVLQTSAWIQAKTWFRPTNPGWHAWGEFSPSHSCCSATGLATPTQNGTMLKQEEKLSVTRPVSVKPILSLQWKVSAFFFFHTTVSWCKLYQHAHWSSSRDLGERPLKISFLFQPFSLSSTGLRYTVNHCNCIRARRNSKFIVNLKIISWGFGEMGNAN